MNSFFNYNNKFFHAVNKILNVCFISILWIVCCIPIFTVGASTTAMYYTVNKVVHHNRSYVFTEFFPAFKRNFKQSTCIWLIVFFSGLIFRLDAYIMKNYFLKAGSMIGNLYIFFNVLLVFEFIWCMYIFPNIAKFENSNRQIMKNAALMAVAHLPWTLLIVVILVLFLFLLLLVQVLIIFLPGAYMWIWSVIMEKNFRRYMSEEELLKEDEQNREYYN